MFTGIILCGGYGSRLHPLTLAVPKPLLPVGRVPMVHRVLDEFQAAGARRAIIAMATPVSQLVRTHFEELRNRGGYIWGDLDIQLVDVLGANNPVDALIKGNLVDDICVLAHCDEFVPSFITRELALTTSKTSHPVIAILTASQEVRLCRVNGHPAKDTSPSIPDDALKPWAVGRYSLTPENWISWVESGLVGNAEQLLDLFVQHAANGGITLGLEFGGPHIDLGTLDKYSRMLPHFEELEKLATIIPKR